MLIGRGYQGFTAQIPSMAITATAPAVAYCSGVRDLSLAKRSASMPAGVSVLDEGALLSSCDPGSVFVLGEEPVSCTTPVRSPPVYG